MSRRPVVSLCIVLQVLLELAAVDAQIGLQDVPDRQAGEVVQLAARSRRAACAVSAAPACSASAYSPIAKCSTVVHEVAQVVRLLAGKLVVIPGRRRIGRQRELIGQVDAGIEFGPSALQIEIQDLRQQDHAVEVDVVVRSPAR